MGCSLIHMLRSAQSADWGEWRSRQIRRGAAARARCTRPGWSGYPGL